MTTGSAAWAARYGAASSTGAAPPFNALLEHLLAHRSVRAYLPTPVPEGTLELLVAAAQSASTSSNLQVWSVVAVQDSQRKARLAQLAGNQGHIRAAPLFLVWLADLARIEAVGQQRGVQVQGLQYLEALLLGVIDAALAAQNAVLALESMGLSSVYIGAIRNNSLGVAAELALPPRVFPVFGMCVGYADSARPAAVKPRLPQAAVLHRESYQAEPQAAAIAHYDRVMADFYAAQGMAAEQWSGHSVERLRTPTSLHGREHLVAALTQLGFVLR